MKAKSWILSLFAASLLAVPAASALHADEPMIVIGGGTEGSTSSSSMNVLLRVGFGVRGSGPVSGTQLIYARMRGDLSVTPNGNGGQIPYMDVEFTPSTVVNGTMTNDGILNGTAYSALPISVRRDLRLDEDVTVDVAVVGVQVGGVHMNGDSVGVYAQVAADALGYKMASHASSMVTFHGVHLGSIGAEAGVFFRPSDDFKVRLALGGQGNVGMGYRNEEVSGGFGLISSEQTRFTAYSDFSAYAEVRVDIARFIEVFARASLNGAWNYEDSTSNNLTRYIQVMGGIAFIY